jgi:uncharacterized protein (TIGR02453 family)
MARKPYFSKATFQFLKDLKVNNNRDWFAENKSRYEEDLKDPALRVIEAFGPELHKISPHFMATPRSLFRIYRDTRFAKDKTPYKTAAGLHFRHERSKDAHAPGFYLHVDPGEIFVGVGIWRPDSQALRMIREHIVEKPADWKRASRGKKFTDAFTLEGDSLKRPPKGFDPEHPLVDDLKRKDFIGVQSMTQAYVTSNDLPKALAATLKPGVPLMRFLCDAVGVPF